jgi:hypothetical protein
VEKRSDGKSNGSMVACYGDWALSHPTIAIEAAEEERGEAEPMECGAMQGDGGEVEQTDSTNHLTALCIWDLAERMIRQDVVGEITWRVNEESTGESREAEGEKRLVKGWRQRLVNTMVWHWDAIEERRVTRVRIEEPKKEVG